MSLAKAVVMLSACSLIQAEHLIKKDFCNMDTLVANCHAENEVIVMKAAQYGRMSAASNCIKNGYTTGCSKDVIEWADKQCSGRKGCELKIPDDDLYAMHPCDDLIAYLHVEYICQKVHQLHFCNDVISLSSSSGVTSTQGFLHYPETSESESCDVTLQAEKGQKINLTLYDFGVFVTGAQTAGVMKGRNGEQKKRDMTANIGSRRTLKYHCSDL